MHGEAVLQRMYNCSSIEDEEQWAVSEASSKGRSFKNIVEVEPQSPFIAMSYS